MDNGDLTYRRSDRVMGQLINLSVSDDTTRAVRDGGVKLKNQTRNNNFVLVQAKLQRSSLEYSESHAGISFKSVSLNHNKTTVIHEVTNTRVFLQEPSHGKFNSVLLVF